MINSTAIIFSLGMVIFFAVRAAFLDRQVPWFDRRRSAGAEDRIQQSSR